MSVGCQASYAWWVASASISLLAASVRAQCETDQFSVHEPPIDDGFGGRIAMRGPTAAIADLALPFGAVYTYHHAAEGWVLEAELTPPEPQPEDTFGQSIAMTDERIVVGADGRATPEFDQGAAYVFHRRADGQWQFEAELIASDGDYGDRFGYSVAIDGDLIIVGAPTDENDGTLKSGSAYVFRFIDGSWQQEHKFFDPAGAALDVLGSAVAVQGPVVIVGAPGNEEAGPDAGAVFVYRYDGATWHSEALLVAPGQPLVAWFGHATALSPDGTLAFIGAPQDDGQTGAVHVFHQEDGQWAHQVKLTASEPAGPFPLFGTDLSVGPGAQTLLVGAPLDFAQGSESGAAHLFRHEGASGWREIVKLTGSGGDAGDHFGGGVALGEDMALIGAGRWGAPGIVYAFAGMRDADCNGNGEPDGCDIFDGVLEDSDGDGIPDECEAGGDVNGDGTVNVVDFLQVLAAWGACPAPCPPGCVGDADGDCSVGAADICAVLQGWQ